MEPNSTAQGFVVIAVEPTFGVVKGLHFVCRRQGLTTYRFGERSRSSEILAAIRVDERSDPEEIARILRDWMFIFNPRGVSKTLVQTARRHGIALPEELKVLDLERTT